MEGVESRTKIRFYMGWCPFLAQPGDCLGAVMPELCGVCMEAWLESPRCARGLLKLCPWEISSLQRCLRLCVMELSGVSSLCGANLGGCLALLQVPSKAFCMKSGVFYRNRSWKSDLDVLNSVQMRALCINMTQTDAQKRGCSILLPTDMTRSQFPRGSSALLPEGSPSVIYNKSLVDGCSLLAFLLGLSEC